MCVVVESKWLQHATLLQKWPANLIQSPSFEVSTSPPSDLWTSQMAFSTMVSFGILRCKSCKSFWYKSRAPYWQYEMKPLWKSRGDSWTSIHSLWWSASFCALAGSLKLRSKPDSYHMGVSMAMGVDGFRGKIRLKWMMTGGTPISGNLHMFMSGCLQCCEA